MMSESGENQMEVSDIASDWDIVQSSVVNLEDLLAGDNCQEKEVEEKSKGSRIQDIKYADISDSLQGILPLEESDKEDDVLQDVDCLSNVSSDVDIIDEIVDDSPSNLIPLEISLGSLGLIELPYPADDNTISNSGSQFSTSVAETTETEPVVQPPAIGQATWLERYGRLIRNRHIRESVSVGIIAFSLACFLLFIAPSPESYDKIKEQVSALQAENTELKSKVSKIEDDKLFVTLEEQIRALKSENSKLGGSMQTLIQQLEEQTAIFRKENEMRVKDPYKDVIDKLKEQVNILQIDNEELQQQLFRMRYGIYSPKPQDGEEAASAQDDTKDHGINKGKNKNISDILTNEEKQELKNEILSELAKLKNWEQSVQNIMKMLGNQQVESVEKEKLKSGHGEPADGPKVVPEQEESTKSKRNKKEKEYDWTWKDLKKNLKGTLDSTLDSLPTINVSDLLSKYGIVDKKKVAGVFESVGHYFKKAQEKTKKILNYDKDMKNDFWEFLGGLRQQWHKAKEEFFQKSFHDTGKNQKPSAAKYPQNYHESDASYKKNKKSKSWHGFESPLNEEQSPNVATKSQEHERPSVVSEKNPDIADKEESGQNSWVFERAAQRSEIRDSEDHTSTNWFLRRRKDADIDDVLADFKSNFFSNFPMEDKVDSVEKEKE